MHPHISPNRFLFAQIFISRMSLGFLTESALVPSKAKPIKVDSQSIVDLKAIVFKKETERKRTLTNGEFSHKHTINKCLSKKQKCSTNRGIDLRRRRDEETEMQDRIRDDSEIWEAKAQSILERKAKLYEAMTSNRHATHDTGDLVMTECLVDFAAKKSIPAALKQGESDDMVEIIDSFGRNRVVSRHSDAYRAYCQAQSEAGIQSCQDTQKDTTSFGESYFKCIVPDKKRKKQERLAKLYEQSKTTMIPSEDQSHADQTHDDQAILFLREIVP